MPVRSHVDPCLFARFIYVEGADVPAAVLREIDGAPDQERYFAAWRGQYEATPHLIFHESYHFWQGVRLPYLYWYGLLSYRAVIQTFAALAQVEDVHDWDTFVPALYRLRLPSRLFRIGGQQLAMSTAAATPTEFLEEMLIAPLDLLEAAATIAEFQVTHGHAAATDVLAFSRWRKRTPSYTRVFSFVSRVLGREDVALRSLLPLINASFSTTDPVRAFFRLLAVLLGNVSVMDDFLAQPEPCRWSELFDVWLEKHAGLEAEPDSTTDLLNPPFCRLTLEKWVNADFEHPVLTNVARAWADAGSDDRTLGWMLDQPAWVSNETFHRAQDEFDPPVTVVRFDVPHERNRVFAMQRPDRIGIDIRDLLTIWSVMRRAARVHFDPDHRLCHHVACPEYGPNFCNSYPIIPERFESCGFPDRLKRIRQELLERRQRDKETQDGGIDDLGGRGDGGHVAVRPESPV